MEIILLLLLVGVGLAVVVPSFLNSRRESTVTQRQTGRAPAQRTAAAGSARERVLARRRNALIALGLGVVATLVAAIVTGSVVLLIVSLVVDVALAGYIAMLLQIKQSSGSTNRHGRWEDTQQVRVVSH